MSNNIPKNITQVLYSGKVSVKYKLKGKEIILKKHNTALVGMFKYLCKMLAGNMNNMNSFKPTYLDIRCKYLDESDNTEKYVSCLYSIIPISNPYFYFDNSEDVNTWVTVFNITVSYSMLNQNILAEHPNNEYYLYLMSGDSVDYASLLLDSSSASLLNIQPGVQAIIEWNISFADSSTT